MPAPAPRQKGLGISGPGAVHAERWWQMNRRVTGSAVKEGLIPDLAPLIPDTQIRDTIVIVGGDGNYYLTGSSGNDIWDHNDGVELWRSPDLRTWTYLGLVWSFEKDATWQKDWRWHRQPVRALWAPELHYIRRLKNYFITLSMPPGDRGLLRSTTGRPEGPYVNALADDGKWRGDIDASLFEDDDGTVYLVYGGGWIARMKDDLSGLAEEPRKPVLLHPDMDPHHHAESCSSQRHCSDIGHEGACLFKRNGKYYLTAADSYEGRYSSMAAISDNIYGPYDQRHEAVPCGGGTDYFQDQEGNWWCAFFGNDDQAPFREKPAIVRVDFETNGRARIADEQPAFILQNGAPTRWRTTLAKSAAPRQSQELSTGWKFIRQDAPVAAPTEVWTTVSLPHTWNALDGQDGPTPGQAPRPDERGSDYFRGIGWYARSLEIPADWWGKRVFALFEAASQRTKIYLNSEELGEHRGGFTAFCVELTSRLKYGGGNELRVQVDNSLVKTIAPLAGDFNVDGGIYRPVHLIVTDPVCISPLESASPGVFLTVRSLRDGTADIEVKTLLSTSLADTAEVEVVTEIKDGAGRVAASARRMVSLAPAASPQPLVQSLPLPNAHLWQGRRDPYLYSVSVRLRRGGRVVDEVVQSLGVRTIAFGADGFLLNGRPYPIYGVNRHQDLKDHGWALSPTADARDVQLILDMGATAVRLAHYPQGENFHNLCDRAGLLLWNEVPFVNNVPDDTEPLDAPSDVTKAFNATLDATMREMILQRTNHPSVAWWGLFNELRPGATNLAALAEVQRLNALAHGLDPTRPTVAASDKVGNPTNAVSDRMAYNVYPGWYNGNGDLGELTKLIDERFTDRKDQRVALSEYGAGGNPAQHQEGTLTMPKANNGPVHPEEWQALMHERDWAQIQGSPKLWGSFVWVMFDFASDGRSEGGLPSINDKGLVTQDRQIRKDAYYFYQANWSDARMVYITSRRLTPRRLSPTEVKIYSNCAEIELVLNGKSLGTAKPDNVRVARWADVQLQPGKNTVRAIGRDSGHEIVDTCEWSLEPTPSVP